MSDKNYDVFLSYSSKDRDWARQLVDALLEQGVRVWDAEREIRPGEAWGERIIQALRDSQYVVVVITPETASSTGLAAELGAALALHKPVIAVVAEDTPQQAIPGPIRLRRWLPKSDPTAIAKEVAAQVTSTRKGESIASA